MVDVSQIILSDGGDEQSFEADTLPLSIGGRAIDEIRIPVHDDSCTVASIGVLDGSAFIQAAKTTQPVRVNGKLLTGSRRITDGDVIRIASAEIACSIRRDTLRLDWRSITAESTADSGESATGEHAPDVIAPTPYHPSGEDSAPA